MLLFYTLLTILCLNIFFKSISVLKQLKSTTSATWCKGKITVTDQIAAYLLEYGIRKSFKESPSFIDDFQIERERFFENNKCSCSIVDFSVKLNGKKKLFFVNSLKQNECIFSPFYFSYKFIRKEKVHNL